MECGVLCVSQWGHKFVSCQWTSTIFGHRMVQLLAGLTGGSLHVCCVLESDLCVCACVSVSLSDSIMVPVFEGTANECVWHCLLFL